MSNLVQRFPGLKKEVFESEGKFIGLREQERHYKQKERKENFELLNKLNKNELDQNAINLQIVLVEQELSTARALLVRLKIIHNDLMIDKVKTSDELNALVSKPSTSQFEKCSNLVFSIFSLGQYSNDTLKELNENKKTLECEQLAVKLEDCETKIKNILSSIEFFEKSIRIFEFQRQILDIQRDRNLEEHESLISKINDARLRSNVCRQEMQEKSSERLNVQSRIEELVGLIGREGRAMSGRSDLLIAFFLSIPKTNRFIDETSERGDEYDRMSRECEYEKKKLDMLHKLLKQLTEEDIYSIKEQLNIMNNPLTSGEYFVYLNCKTSVQVSVFENYGYVFKFFEYFSIVYAHCLLSSNPSDELQQKIISDPDFKYFILANRRHFFENVLKMFPGEYDQNFKDLLQSVEDQVSKIREMIHSKDVRVRELSNMLFDGKTNNQDERQRACDRIKQINELLCGFPDGHSLQPILYFK